MRRIEMTDHPLRVVGQRARQRNTVGKIDLKTWSGNEQSPSGGKEKKPTQPGNKGREGNESQPTHSGGSAPVARGDLMISRSRHD